MSLENVSLNLVEHWDEAQSLMTWLGERRQILACDTETGGFNWWDPAQPLRTVQFGDTDCGWTIPWAEWGGMVKDIFRTYTGDVVFHNAKFDIKYLEHSGVVLDRTKVHDTLTMAHLLDPRSSVALKSLGVRYVDPTAADGQTELKKAMTQNRWTWATIPYDFEAYWVYAALDTVITANLFQQFAPQIVGRLHDVYELEIATSLIVNDMERRGIRVDLAYCEQERTRLLDEADGFKQWTQDTYGFDVGSNPQLAAALLKAGARLRKKTDKGAWSVDEAVLSQLEDDFPIAKIALAVRGRTKTANAYFRNFINLADGDVLHPTVWTLGAKTGRMSVSAPALQQLPAEDAEVRDAFVPRDGNKLFSIDYDQIEARLMAHFSQDPGMIAAFAADGDFFTNMARLIYQDDTIEKKDPRRNVTKHANYAKLFGAGVPKFSHTAGIPVAEGEQFLRAYDRAYPGVKAFQKALSDLAVKRARNEGVAYVTTPSGRHQPTDPDATYKLTNYLIQGSAADVLKHKIVELSNVGLTDYLVLPVHDELIFDVPADEVADFGREVQEVMEQGDWTVPLTCGSDVLDRWGEKYRDGDFKMLEEYA